MFKHMLIPIDGSQCASDALRHAIELARDMHARVTLLVVTQPFHTLSAEANQIERVRDEFEKFQQEHAEQYLGWAREFTQGHAVTCDTVQIEHDHPYEAIIDTASKRGCDVIAMGSHGRSGVKALVLGSVTQKVLTHCQTPVLVYR